MNSTLNWKIGQEMLSKDENEMWDFCPPSCEEEAFTSWFARLSKSNCSDVGMLYLKLMGSNSRTIKSINRKEMDKSIPRLESSKTTQDELKRSLSKYVKIASFQTPSLSFEFAPNAEANGNYLRKLLPTPRFCPFCLNSDKIPYFRIQWFFRFTTYCDIHKCLLLDTCPHCFSPIKYWQNEWNQSITICHNCRNDITQDVKFVSKIDANFQLKFYDIIRTSRLKGKKMDPIHFLQKIWRVAQNVSLDSKIKEEEGITTERMFVALNLADKFIEFDQKRLEEPYVCPYDGTNFSNSIELNLHLTQEHNQNIMSDPCLIERYALIKPFIEQGITNKNDILRMAINLNLSFHSVYKWVRVYKKYGFIGLAKKKRVKGRRSKRFSDAIYQILEDNVAKYNEKTMTPRSCWNKIVQECRKLPDDQSKIPSMTTVANRIKRQLNLRKFESF